MIKRTEIALTLAILMLLAGCAQMFTSKTTVSVNKTPDGACSASYTSDKEQQGLEAEVCGGRVKVDKSGTLESVVASTLQLNSTLLRLIEQLAVKPAPVPVK